MKFKTALQCLALALTFILPTSTTTWAQDETSPYVKTTKTVERTTTKTYTITKQRVGLVGGRPYPVKQEKEDGGVTVETFVNDVKTDTNILKPDPMLDGQQAANSNRKPYEYPFREYTTEPDNVGKIEVPGDVKLRSIGRFND